MALVKRSNSKFWYVQFQIKHVTIIRSTRTSDRKTAERVAAKIRAEAHEQIMLGRKKSSTVAEAIDRFIKTKSGTPNHRNLLIHSKAVQKHIRGSMQLSALTTSLVEEFKQSRFEAGYAPQSVKHELNCLMSSLKKARREGYECPDIVAPIVKIPIRKARFLSTDEEHRLLRELDPERQANGLAFSENRFNDHQKFMQDNYDLIVILLDTGARYGEIANIKWSQINLEQKSISLWRPKVQNESIIYMTDRVFEILRRRIQAAENQFLFNNKAGLARGYSSMAIRKALKRAGLNDCTIHTLRHTHASRLIQNGLSVYEVSLILGHSDIKTTMRYAHLEQTSVTLKARDVINRLSSGPKDAYR